MAIEPIKPVQQQEGEEEQIESSEQFESDTQRIIHRHLANPDDIITDEDIKSVRIGMTPPDGESLEDLADRFEQEINLSPERTPEEESKDTNNESEGIPPTPWEVVNDD